MCTYARVVFSCQHERWGLRVKPCKIADDFRTGDAKLDCVSRKPHAVTSRKLPRKCNKCIGLDAKVDKAKKGIAELKKTLRELEIREAEIKKNEIKDEEILEKENQTEERRGLETIQEEAERDEQDGDMGQNITSSGGVRGI
ncbi:hypothetical protein ACJ41O_002732 [Fusarium nematophilum]